MVHQKTKWGVSRPVHRIVFHCGLHKTASTTFQWFCREHFSDLMEHGVYFPVVTDYPAHHNIAWSLLSGNSTELEVVIERIPKQCCTLLISSEDLENLLCDPISVTRIEQAADILGFSSVEYCFVLRNPGQYFASILSQMSNHGVYLDWLQAFDEVIRTGVLSVKKSKFDRCGIPGGWNFVFDYSRSIAEFQEITKGKVHIFDYHEKLPFPGSRILTDVAFGGQRCDWLTLPRDSVAKRWQNPRLGISEQATRYSETLARHIGTTDALNEELAEFVQTRAPSNRLRQALCGRIDELYGNYARLTDQNDEFAT